MHREEDGAVHFWRIKENMTVGGKYAWQEEEEIKEDSSTALMSQE